MVAISQTRYSSAEKLRRATSAGAISRMWGKPPMKVPPAWATGVATVAGDVVASNNLWWVAANSGTTGATAPTTFSNNVTSDGAVQWLCIGGPTLAADEALLPTVTYSGTVAGGRTVQWRPQDAPDLFLLRGCEKTVGQTDFRARTLNDGSVADSVRACAVSFITDAPILTVNVTSSFNTGQLSMAIDGRLVSLTPFLKFSNGLYAHVDLSAMGGRKAKRIDLIGSVGLRINAILLNPTDSLWRPETPNAVKGVMISDSQFAGHSFGLKLVGGDPLSRFADNVGWTDWWNYSTAGTGYIAKGAGSAFYTFGERVAQVLAMAVPPSVVCFHGSTNDNGETSAAITAAALAAYRALRNGGYKGLIVVFGIWSLSAATAVTEAAIAAAVTQFNDPNTIYIPISQAVNPPITGSWNNTAYPPGTGTVANNASMLVNSTDAIHLMEIAADPTTQWMAEQYRKQLLAAA